MTMTDPIADMLTRIRNANVAMHEEVRMPSSKQRVAQAKILKQEGYIEGFEVGEATDRPGDLLTITMKYSPERARTISGIKRVSKPGLRVYRGADKLPRVLGGLGVAIAARASGVLARGVGGMEGEQVVGDALGIGRGAEHLLAVGTQSVYPERNISHAVGEVALYRQLGADV